MSQFNQTAFMVLFGQFIVQDVCLSSPRVAWEFYHAARDALLLYEAIIPVKVLLMSLKVGGVGLNLTAACNVFLMVQY
ncbi:hypothetical protein U1Q18_037477 [Sarracenia purpurea var. burkii]